MATPNKPSAPTAQQGNKPANKPAAAPAKPAPGKPAPGKPTR